MSPHWRSSAYLGRYKSFKKLYTSNRCKLKAQASDCPNFFFYYWVWLVSARGDFLIWSFSGKTRSIRLSVACTPAPSDSESLAIRCRLQMFWWLIKNKKQKSKSNLLFKQQSILIASGFVLSQVIIFIKLWHFFPLWMFTMSIFQIGFNVQMDLRRCHFFFKTTSTPASGKDGAHKPAGGKSKKVVLGKVVLKRQKLKLSLCKGEWTEGWHQHPV